MSLEKSNLKSNLDMLDNITSNYSNRSKNELLTLCIKNKLDINLSNYLLSLNSNMKLLLNQNPIDVFKTISKMELK